MTPQNLLVFMAVAAVAVVVMAWYANSSKRNKIYCSFTRVNKTSIHKFVKMSSRYVVWDGKRYDIVPSCVIFDWWDKGLVNMLFPQWVATMDYTYASRWPIDKTSGKPVIISPEVRNSMNKEDWVRSYAKGFTPPSSKKQSAITQFLPWIAIVLVVVVAVYFYVNLQSMGKIINMIESQIQSIAR